MILSCRTLETDWVSRLPIRSLIVIFVTFVWSVGKLHIRLRNMPVVILPHRNQICFGIFLDWYCPENWTALAENHQTDPKGSDVMHGFGRTGFGRVGVFGLVNKSARSYDSGEIGPSGQDRAAAIPRMICISEFEITPSCSATLEQASRKERFAKGVILANFGRFSFIERRSHLSKGGRLTGAERSRERKPFSNAFSESSGFPPKWASAPRKIEHSFSLLLNEARPCGEYAPGFDFERFGFQQSFEHSIQKGRSVGQPE